MEKNEITLSFDSEKMEALVFYLKKENTTVQKKMDEALRLLYGQTVPEPLREYLDARSAPARPRRPARPSQPKPDAPRQMPVPTNQGKEDAV
ncbi:DUF6103 family protein [Oscillospiraceae bacterium 50-60]